MCAHNPNKPPDRQTNKQTNSPALSSACSAAALFCAMAMCRGVNSVPSVSVMGLLASNCGGTCDRRRSISYWFVVVGDGGDKM